MFSLELLLKLLLCVSILLVMRNSSFLPELLRLFLWRHTYIKSTENLHSILMLWMKYNTPLFVVHSVGKQRKCWLKIRTWMQNVPRPRQILKPGRVPGPSKNPVPIRSLLSSGVIRGLNQEGKLSWSRPTRLLANNNKSWEIIVNPDVDVYTKSRINQKTMRRW